MTKKLLPRIRHENGLQAQHQISNDPAHLRLRRRIESEGEILDLVLANKAKQRLEAIGDNARVGRESGKSFRQGIRHGRALRHSLGRVAVALRVRGAVRNALLARGPGGHLGLGGPVPGVLLLLLISVRWLGAVWLGCAATCSEVGSGSVGAATAWDASS